MASDMNFSTCFTQTINTSTLMASPLTPQHTDSAPATIKMEDLNVGFDIPSPSLASPASLDSSTPPTATEAKPVKKRKSWGQVLPEPKTALPPRKRAKTEDEKEQRRIERVKRNRLAAHNSRERKRQEYEVLQAEKDQMETDLQSLQDEVALLRGELSFYRNKYPGEAPEPVMDFKATTKSTDTVCPASTSASFASPISLDSMDSPADSYQPDTPASTFMASPNLDSTQYPAVSVDFGSSLALGDVDVSFSLQSLTSSDEKPVVLDNLFDFDQFPDNASCSMESTLNLADAPSADFFGSAFFDTNSTSGPYGLSDGFNAKLSDLQSTSGAA